ncbi:hypothetical protein KGA66_06060 [Actinocrinis puniceicyclus]|uniref:Uncharacterized protein n=1 Tax=Actinocrinis puniceicyclus TaxID=977794 RepID=A0A8J8BB03_9ACTN|nr:hypothetical protein [Actinocrinis puniceicyclus]MBS2962603.1 hypothetical protein [Actinocrinis puniceicyclus]
MTHQHNRTCAACRQRPAWAARWICVPCYLALREDLHGLVGDYRWLGECMVLLPPSWRTSSIRAFRTETPIPFDARMSLQRDRITETLAYWARMVVEAKRPRPWPPHDVTVEATAPWLTTQLGWIVRQEAAGDFDREIRGLRVDTDRVAPRELEWRSLPLPCPRCGQLALSHNGGLVACRRGGCGHAMTLGEYHQLEDEIAAALAERRQAQDA